MTRSPLPESVLTKSSGLRSKIAQIVATGLTVLGTAASTYFGLFPVGAAAGCYEPSDQARIAALLSVGLGALALVGWVYLLRDRRRNLTSIVVSGVVGFVIVIVFVLPAIILSQPYVSAATDIQPMCAVPTVSAIVGIASCFNALIVAVVAYILARFVPRVRLRVPAECIAAVVLWIGYLLVVRVFWVGS